MFQPILFTVTCFLLIPILQFRGLFQVWWGTENHARVDSENHSNGWGTRNSNQWRVTYVLKFILVVSWIWAFCWSKLEIQIHSEWLFWPLNSLPFPFPSPLFANRRKANSVPGLLSRQSIPLAMGACLAYEVKIILCIAVPRFLPKLVTLCSMIISFPSACLTCISLDECTGWGFGQAERGCLFPCLVFKFRAFIVSTWGGD